MTDETIKALVDYRMEKSRESIKAAKLMVKEKMLNRYKVNISPSFWKSYSDSEIDRNILEGYHYGEVN